MNQLNNTIGKLRRIANRCREAKGWKGGAIAARSTIDSRGASNSPSVGNLYIYAMIGSSWFEEGVTAEGVRQALDGLRGVKTLNIFINSEGGDVFEAKAIYTQLKRFAAEKVVHIDGLAASAATFIAMAGDRIVTSPAATWMIHEAWTVAMGNAGDLRDSADLLEMINEDIAKLYADRTGKDISTVRELMAAETWMTAQEALDLGFTDEIATFADDAEDDAPAAKASGKLEAVAETTHQRIAAMTADLLQFRARRATASAPAEIAKAPEPQPQQTTRTSADKQGRTAKPASR